MWRFNPKLPVSSNIKQNKILTSKRTAPNRISIQDEDLRTLPNKNSKGASQRHYTGRTWAPTLQHSVQISSIDTTRAVGVWALEHQSVGAPLLPVLLVTSEQSDAPTQAERCCVRCFLWCQSIPTSTLWALGLRAPECWISGSLSVGAPSVLRVLEVRVFECQSTAVSNRSDVDAPSAGVGSAGASECWSAFRASVGACFWWD
jgi:hypothetical protein